MFSADDSGKACIDFLMRDDIKRAFREEAFTRPNCEAAIVQTALGYEAGLLGAAALAFCPPLDKCKKKGD